jgi:polyisoprenoid-binding protein YceI
MYRNILLFLFIGFFSYSTSLLAQNGQRYDILTGKSNVKWSATKVTGGHNGLIQLKRGYLSLTDAGELEHATVFINMQSISCLDLEDDESKTKLVNHLKSDDFFSSKKFPEAVFKIYKVTPFENSKEFTHTIEGALTIKGYTNKLAFPVKLEKKDGLIYISGKTDVDRTLYNIKYGSGKFFENLGDKMIYDLFTIDFKLIAAVPEK